MQLPLLLALERRSFIVRWLCRGDVIALRLLATGRLELIRAQGEHEEAEVAADSTVFSRLVILRLKTAVGQQSLLLPRAALGEEGHRRLRVWLRWCIKRVA